jgi:ABC-type branched-subunit amino acid transport system substrate-binding protein
VDEDVRNVEALGNCRCGYQTVTTEMMNSRGDKRKRIKSATAIIALAVIAWLQSECRISAQTATGLSPEEKRGKQIYLKGEGEGGEITAVVGGAGLELPGSSFACANCHGLRGEGANEGGLQPPPLKWSTLTAKHTSALTGRERAPYLEATLARAIRAGTDPAGGTLHPGMPRYKMTPAQMADLIAYLKKIGNEVDLEPGLRGDAIRIGAALPLSGPLARIGEDVKAALGACFAEINGQGGVYGRKLELVVADSRGDEAGTMEATRELVEKQGVFALAGSFEPGNSQAANEYLKKSEVPLVAPVTLSPLLPSVPNPFIFYLLPSFNDQARALVDFIGSEQTRPKGHPASRLAVVYSGNQFDRDAVSGLRAQIKEHSMQLVAERGYEAGRLSPATQVEALASKKPDYIFFFGNGDDFLALARELDRVKLEVGLLTSSITIGRAAFSMPATVASRTYLSYPVSLAGRDDFTEFLAVLKKANVQLRGVAFQANAFAAAKVLVEALKSAGSQLNRSSLIASLETLRGFQTGVLPPITFGPNRRVGASGSYIVGIDPIKKQYTPLGDRIVPKGSNQY